MLCSYMAFPIFPPFYYTTSFRASAVLLVKALPLPIPLPPVHARGEGDLKWVVVGRCAEKGPFISCELILEGPLGRLEKMKVRMRKKNLLVHLLTVNIDGANVALALLLNLISPFIA